MFGQKDAAKLGERRGGRPILERAQDHLPVGDLQREDAGASAVGALKPVGQLWVVDQAGELEQVAVGIGRRARTMLDTRSILPEHAFVFEAGRFRGRLLDRPEPTGYPYRPIIREADARVKSKRYRTSPVGRQVGRFLRAIRWSGLSRNTLESYETTLARLAVDHDD